MELFPSQRAPLGGHPPRGAALPCPRPRPRPAAPGAAALDLPHSRRSRSGRVLRVGIPVS